MKHILSLIFCAALTITANAQVTFTVDGKLPEVKRLEIMKRDSKGVAMYWMEESGAKKCSREGIIASSFDGDSIGIIRGRNVLYNTIVESYAEHRPLVLSPDMIWLNICQVFSHYVQENAEAMRDKLVCHEGKMELVVETEKDLLTEAANWDSIMTAFAAQIDANTKDGIARTLEADFSTTTTATRTASCITLMSAMSPFFDYTIFRAACGIPSITLTGTPDDWRKVLSKTEELEAFDMQWFTTDLKPILQQFVAASEGKADQKFWRSMVRKRRIKKLSGGNCSPDAPTRFDGWFTALFPYQKTGMRATVHTNLSDMLPGVLMTDFRYVVVGDGPTRITPMELWSGFIGVDEDPATHSLTPRIGWFVRNCSSKVH